MFQSKDNRYVNKNVDSIIPKKMQFFLWGLIDDIVFPSYCCNFIK